MSLDCSSVNCTELVGSHLPILVYISPPLLPFKSSPCPSSPLPLPCGSSFSSHILLTFTNFIILRTCALLLGGTISRFLTLLLMALHGPISFSTGAVNNLLGPIGTCSCCCQWYRMGPFAYVPAVVENFAYVCGCQKLCMGPFTHATTNANSFV